MPKILILLILLGHQWKIRCLQRIFIDNAMESNVSPPNSYAETLTLGVSVFGDRAHE